jgi:competence protein ComEC
MRYSWRRIAGLPAVRILVFLITGILLQWYLPLQGEVLLPLGAVLLLPCSVLAWKARRTLALRPLRDAAAALMVVLCGMLRTADTLEHEATALLAFADVSEKIYLSGMVSEEPRMAHDRQRFRMDCRLVEAGGRRTNVDGRVLVTWRRSRFDATDRLRTLRRGDSIRVRCRLRTPLPPRFPGGFDARSWLIGEQCLLMCSVSKGSDLTVITHEPQGFLTEAVHDIRSFVRGVLHARYTQEHASVMVGLLLGDRGLIDDETLENFRRSGIMHILAVSGLHAGIILLLVFIPTERLPYAVRAVLASAGLWLFAAVTGFAAPVTRAALMGTLTLSSVVLQRQGNTVNALAAAGVIILLINPLALTGLSFQLSFTAVLGILLFHARITDALLSRIPGWLARRALTRAAVNLLALTLSAQALSIPFLLHAFGEVSPAGLLTNLVAVPLVFLVVTCSVLSVVTSPFALFLAERCAAIAGLALDGILAASGFLAALPAAAVSIPALPIGALYAYVAVIMYVTTTYGRLRQKLALVGLSVVAVLLVASVLHPETPPQLRVTFLDVGQGDAALIELPDRSAVLIDTGPGGHGSDAGTRTILPYLRTRGIQTLHTLAITHPDEDHRGGAEAIVSALPVRQVLLGGSWPREGAAGALFRRMSALADTVRDVRAGQRIDFPGDARLYVLSPPPGEAIEASNEHSLVLLLQYGRTRFLFTGDADASAERVMIARYDSFLRADVLKVGHHGSTTSTSPGFAVKVAPSHALISAGRNNSFNHPRKEILTRLRLVGAKISRTDVEGSIVFVSDGEHVRKVPAAD